MIFPGLAKPLSLVIPNCSHLFWCYHRIASEQILITDVIKCGTQQQSLLPKPICEFHWAWEVNNKQVILWMAMSSQHCCLDLFLFCLLFKNALWVPHDFLGWYQYPGLSPSLSLPPFNLQYLSWTVLFHSLLGKWFLKFYSCCYSPCEESVPERNCGLKKLWQIFRFYTHQVTGKICGFFLIFHLLLCTSYEDAKYQK